MDHRKFLDLAYKEALKAYKKDEVPVGAVLVKDGEVISKGHNQRITKDNSILHAEMVVILKACKKLKNYRLDGSTLYITLEPCLMCTGAIVQSRVEKVVFGAKNEKEGAIITKYTIFDDRKFSHNPEYIYLPDERCSGILKEFFKIKRANHGR